MFLFVAFPGTKLTLQCPRECLNPVSSIVNAAYIEGCAPARDRELFKFFPHMLHDKLGVGIMNRRSVSSA